MTRWLKNPWIIWSGAGLFYAYQNLLQVSQSVMTEHLMHDFQLNASSLGLLNSMFLWPYAILQIPVGVAYDRLQTRTVLCAAIFTCALATAIHAIAPTAFWAGVARFLIGSSAAFAALGCLRLAQLWFPSNRFASLTGLTITIGMLGQLFGEAPLAWLVAKWPWRDVFWLASVVGLLICLWSRIGVPHDPKTTAPQNTKEQTILQDLQSLFTMPTAWIVALFAGLIFAPFLVLTGLWGIPYLKLIYHTSTEQAAAHFSWLLIGFALGAPLLGGFSDHIEKRRPPLLIGALGTTIVGGILFVFPPENTYVLDLLLACFGFLTGGSLPAFSLLKEYVPSSLRTTSLGFMNTFNTLGGALALPMVGMILDYYGQTPSLHAYHWALASCPIMTGIACLLYPFLPETNATNNEEVS